MPLRNDKDCDGWLVASSAARDWGFDGWRVALRAGAGYTMGMIALGTFNRAANWESGDSIYS